ncbi:alpha/beta hydrolase [Solihabitans fulvus]|uniref:Alpha/beta hydrolase n=1 Tax=Solihabitans fulvus TaxID=1892852 RepID=A0A5B2WNJ4_9PSEU|nr:alpha/beta hydrolase [Solihabitans fulvus]KAA2253361.1 alpha/beta hydrolase [Solihabitans fulvus]
MVERVMFDGFGGVRLSGVDFGGDGSAILLLHGLMGRATTWAETAGWLTGHGRVVAIDQRGHGHSDKPAGPYDRAARVADVAAVIDQLALGPAVVIGHSMGGLTGWQLAADHPELVRALVIADMDATASLRQDKWRAWFADWPLPFPSLADVRAYFGGGHAGQGDYFTEVMAEGADGYRPMFEFEHMLALQAGWDGRDHFAELDAVRCPALMVAGELSTESTQAQRDMADRLSVGEFACVAGAGHTLHFDNPGGWRAAVEPFVARQVSSVA